MKPTIQPQPTQSEYGFDVTDLFPRLTRASYRAATGEQAAPWDRARRITRFYDETALALPPDDTYTIQYWDVSGAKAIRRTERITNHEASHPNLPGAYDYPKYAPIKSGLYVPKADEELRGRQYVDVFALSDFATADHLRLELKEAGFDVAENIEEEQLAPPFSYIAEEGENRRVLNLIINGQPQNVGWMLKGRYANGIGSPGAWKPFGATVAWETAVSLDVGTFDPRPEIHIPQRALLPNERIVVVQIGVAVIQRTDIANPIVDQAEMPGRVGEILTIVKEIRDRK